MEEDVRQKRIADNVALVPQIARPYEGRGVAWLDLLQAGNLGLIDAAAKYENLDDPVKFSWLAAWHIRQNINKLFPRNRESV